jgi:hypothetical protein
MVIEMNDMSMGKSKKKRLCGRNRHSLQGSEAILDLTKKDEREKMKY